MNELTFKQDQKMRIAFYERFPEFDDLQDDGVEWGVDTATKISYTWNFTVNGIKHTQTLNRETGVITNQ